MDSARTCKHSTQGFASSRHRGVGPGRRVNLVATPSAGFEFHETLHSSFVADTDGKHDFGVDGEPNSGLSPIQEQSCSS